MPDKKAVVCFFLAAFLLFLNSSFAIVSTSENFSLQISGNLPAGMGADTAPHPFEAFVLKEETKNGKTDVLLENLHTKEVKTLPP